MLPYHPRSSALGKLCGAAVAIQAIFKGPNGVGGQRQVLEVQVRSTSPARCYAFFSSEKASSPTKIV